MHGDLMFAGVEKVLRTVDRDSDEFSVAVLDVTRADTINDAARHLLAGMNSILQAAGKKGFVVDPIPSSSGRTAAMTTWCSATSTTRWPPPMHGCGPRPPVEPRQVPPTRLAIRTLSG